LQNRASPSSPSVREAARGIPDPLASFVGRETELRQIARLLEGTRLVSLTGPGGSGKTRLAAEAAPPAARYASEGLRAGGYLVYFNEATQRHRVTLTKLTER
jgi:hypothetical protein